MKKFQNALFLLTFSLFVCTAQAATFTVNSTTDEIDNNIGNGVCQTASGKCSLRAAIQEANFTVATDTINIPAGIFKTQIIGFLENAAATGDYDITQPLIIKGAGINNTIIDAQNLGRAFDIVGNVSVKISDLSIKSGKESTGGSPSTENGGCIRSASQQLLEIDSVSISNCYAEEAGALLHVGSLKINNSIIKNNFANDNGAGVIASALSGNFEISQSEFSNNFSVGAGGALLLQTANDVKIIIKDTVITNNQGEVGSGIAIAITDTSSVDISGVELTNNRSETAGAIYLSSGSTGNITIQDSLIAGNLATQNIGGAYILTTNGHVKVNNTLIENNLALNQVGGIYIINSSGDGILIENSIIRGNTANNSFGGGWLLGLNNNIIVKNSEVSDNSALGIAPSDLSAGGLAINGGNAEIINSKFYRNSNFYTVGGGAIASNDTESVLQSLKIKDSDFRDNFSIAAGGAIYITDIINTVEITGSVFAGNSVPTSAGIAGAVLIQAPQSISLVNSTFSSNAAAIAADLYLTAVNGTTITNVTATNQITTLAIASFLIAGSPATIRNSIFNSSIPTMSVCGISSSVVSLGNNISSDATCGFIQPSDLQNTNPLLEPLANNGGNTLTHKISIGSPALDGGSNAGCPAVDQRGVARPFDGDLNGTAICDIGAFESNDLCPADPNKLSPGVCGCGTADIDSNSNNITDCLGNADLSAQAKKLRSSVAKILTPTGKKAIAKQRKRAKEVKTLANALLAFAKANSANITVKGKVKLLKLVKSARGTARRATAFNDAELASLKQNAKIALTKLIKALK